MHFRLSGSNSQHTVPAAQPPLGANGEALKFKFELAAVVKLTADAGNIAPAGFQPGVKPAAY
jgi:hypothetical protein